MSDKPKPLTKAEWESGAPDLDVAEWRARKNATLDALFAYRERTRGIWFGTVPECTDDIAAEEGIE